MGLFLYRTIKTTTEFIPGDFSFVKDELWRDALTDGYKAVEKVGQSGWNELKDHDTQRSFMYGKNTPIIEEITKNMEVEHSGSSYGITMRNLEYIAKHGWKEYVTNKNTKTK